MIILLTKFHMLNFKQFSIDLSFYIMYFTSIKYLYIIKKKIYKNNINKLIYIPISICTSTKLTTCIHILAFEFYEIYFCLHIIGTHEIFSHISCIDIVVAKNMIYLKGACN